MFFLLCLNTKMAKQIHYNIDKLINTYPDANIYIIFGEKSNGKSYQVKDKIIFDHYQETGMRSIIMRRWKEDMKALWKEKYFKDVDVAKKTENKYSCISYYKDEIFYSNYDAEKNKIIRGEKFGYFIPLTQEQHYSSADFTDCDVIVLEEFMERGSYIPGEVKKLMAFYSTVDRKRGVTKMFLIGNTISKVNPYIPAWNLEKVFKNLKQGEMTQIEIVNEGDDINEKTIVKIAIEYCGASGGKQMSIGSSMIDKGGWDTNPQPSLPKSYKKYDVKFRCVYKFKSYMYMAEFLQDKETKDICWFVYPKNTQIRKNTFVFSDEISTSPFWFRNPYDIITLRNQKLKKLFETFRESIIFFSDDLTGTDFKNSIDFMIKR